MRAEPHTPRPFPRAHVPDYTLIHYDVEAWEGKAYAYGRQSLREMGCPVEGLRFDRSLVIRGLIMDTGGLQGCQAGCDRCV